ncbi:MAG TPA: AraC family transcriptional regulator [Opitutaceae bacterium]
MAKETGRRLKLDIYGLQTRLIWANERIVEEQFLQVDATQGAHETVGWYLNEGAVTVTYARGVSVRAKAGEWLFLRGEEGRQRFTPGTRLISLRFHLRLRGGKPLFARRRDLVVKGPKAAELREPAQRLVREFERVEAPGTMYVARERLSLVDNFRIEAAFMDWLGSYVEMMEAARETPEAVDERDTRVAKALILIEDHRMRDKFSESELARRCGLGVNQLGRLFRGELGMSPFQYYEGRRLELARHALAESSLPVKEIGFELGFSSPPHFSNWFTKHTGVSPRAWREAGGAPAGKPEPR